MICSFHRTSASLSEYIQYFFFISSINYEVPLTSSMLFKSCIEYKVTSMAICVMLSPLCLNASHASWGRSEYRLIMPDAAAYVPPLTESHISTLGSHFHQFSGLNLRAKPHLFRISTTGVCLPDFSSSHSQRLLLGAQKIVTQTICCYHCPHRDSERQ